MKAKGMNLDRNWPAIIVGYFILQIILRSVMPGGLGLDEAQVILDADSFAWGYGPQPPLYNWLQHALFVVVGENKFALSLLKNALLCLTYLCLYALLRTRYERAVAGLATLSLFLLPQIAWESQRALTHSVLVTTMVMVTVFLFWRLNERRTVVDYLLFGIAIGLGCLSKYNYVFTAVAMLVAAVSLPDMRRSVLNWRLGVSAVVAVLVVAKPVMWIRDNTELALSSTRKFDMGGGGGAIGSALSGSLNFVEAVILFLALALVVVTVFALLFRSDHADRTEAASLLFSFLVRTVVVASVLTFVVVVLSGTTNVKDRWMQPVLVLAAPALVLWLVPRITTLGRGRLGMLIAILAAVVFVAIPVNMLYGTPDKPSYRSAPFPALIDRIEKDYVGENRIYAENGWIAGNIAYLRPDWVVVTPGRLPDTMAAEDEFVLAWWPHYDRLADKARASLEQASGRTPAVSEAQIFSHEYLMHGKKFQVGLARARLGAED